MQILLGLLALAGIGDEKYSTWVCEVAARDVLPPSIAQRLSPAELAAIDVGQPVPPFGDLIAGERGKDGDLWIGSKHGLMHIAPRAPSWQLFHSRHWLPDDHIQELSVASDSEVWVRTPAATCRLTRQETTLDKKMAHIQSELRRMHVRQGMICEIQLKQPGKTDGQWVQPSSDNDGLWTSMYVAAEAYRYAVTHDGEAKKNARQSLEALMLLERITGIPGFVARSIVPADDHPKKYGGEWYPSADKRWWWKADTSSDELDGHYYAYALYYDLVADSKEKEEIRPYVARITDHILDHGYHYVGPGGKPTTWGSWAPEDLNRNLKFHDDRGLNSMEMLSHLKVADHVVGTPRYRQAAKELIERHSYAINTVDQKLLWPPEQINHSDDELAFLAYHPLLIYERDPELRKIYLASITRSWQVERPEVCPLFNFIYAAALQASTWPNPAERPSSAQVDPKKYDRDLCIKWFRDVPQDLIIWTVNNSGRRDLGEIVENRFGRARTRKVLSVAERHVMRWNGDPYQIDGGSGGSNRDDGTFILLPYWMGRYHRFLE